MSAKEQYEHHHQVMVELQGELDKGLAGLLLTFPFPISYKNWVFLHKVKGDWE